MKRAEFMSRLESLLGDLQDIEKEEALQYYNDYFDDAGAENEESVIESLGTPESVAESIKKGSMDGENQEAVNKYTPADPNNIVDDKSTADEAGTKKKEKKKMSDTNIAIIIIICVLGSPIILSALGVLISVLATIFGLVIAAFAIVLALAVVAGGVFFAGIGAIVGSSPLIGGCLIGTSLIILGMFLISLWLAVAFCVYAVPAIIRLIKKGWNYIFKKGDKE